MYSFTTFDKDLEICLSHSPVLVYLYVPLKGRLYAPKSIEECDEDEIKKRNQFLEAANIDTVVESFFEEEYAENLLNELNYRISIKPNSIFRFHMHYVDKDVQSVNDIFAYYNTGLKIFMENTKSEDFSAPRAPKLVTGRFKSEYLALVIDEFKEEIINGESVNIVDIFLWDLALC